MRYWRNRHRLERRTPWSIGMTSQDILISRDLAADETIAGLSAVLSVEPKEVVLVADWDEFPIARGAPVICHRTHLGGHYPLILHLYINALAIKPSNDLEAVRHLCKIWQCDCLMSDDSLNPYLMLHVSRTGEASTVSVDVEKLDNLGEYWLSPHE